MAEVDLREYGPADLEAMYALDLRCFEPPFRFSRRAMRDAAESPGALTLLAEAEGQLAGFCLAHMQEHVGYVVTLDVAPEWRRRGLARRLMAGMEEKALEVGGEAMALHVFTGNTAAIRLYETAGYARLGTAAAFYGPGRDALIYQKRLDGT